MLDQSMNWQDAESVRKKWGKQFCLKGIMSVADAKRAVEIGATAIMVSNHGGRQLDGSRSPFDQLAEIVDAVGDKIQHCLQPCPPNYGRLARGLRPHLTEREGLRCD